MYYYTKLTAAVDVTNALYRSSSPIQCTSAHRILSYQLKYNVWKNARSVQVYNYEFGIKRTQIRFSASFNLSQLTGNFV